MAALTAAAQRPARGELKGRFKIPVEASAIILKGGIVGINAAGYAFPAVLGATVIQVAGIAAESVTGTSQGAMFVEVEFGREYLFTASSVTQAQLGDKMLVVDDNTVDETAAASASVGNMTEFVSTTQCWVFVWGLASIGIG